MAYYTGQNHNKINVEDRLFVDPEYVPLFLKPEYSWTQE